MPYKTKADMLEAARQYRITHAEQIKLKRPERNRKYREAHPDYFKNWFKAHPEKRLGYQRKYRKSHPAPHRRDNAKFRANNPEKVVAHNTANHAIKIPEGQLCVRCGKVPATDKHHPDYSKPLEVVFVCENCHVILDKERREGLTSSLASP